MNKPFIGFTIGDPAGIGPEIALKAALDPAVRRQCQPVLIGPKELWEQTAKTFRLKLAGLEVHDIYCSNYNVRPGAVSAESGRIAAESVVAAAVLALDGKIPAMVTAPISKYAIRSAGYKQAGHTELLAELSQVRSFAMMFVSPRMKTTLATIHVNLARVPRLITPELIREKYALTERALSGWWGIKKPRIAVLGLNPHAGEDGILGKEETEVIGPAVKSIQQAGSAAIGPVSAEAGLRMALDNKADALLAMYHDQGLLPIKMLGGASNLTLGLPFIRTSPDHGTALDIAWRGTADVQPMIRAVLLAVELCCRK